MGGGGGHHGTSRGITIARQNLKGPTWIQFDPSSLSLSSRGLQSMEEVRCTGGLHDSCPEGPDSTYLACGLQNKSWGHACSPTSMAQHASPLVLVVIRSVVYELSETAVKLTMTWSKQLASGGPELFPCSAPPFPSQASCLQRSQISSICCLAQ